MQTIKVKATDGNAIFEAVYEVCESDFYGDFNVKKFQGFRIEDCGFFEVEEEAIEFAKEELKWKGFDVIEVNVESH